MSNQIPGVPEGWEAISFDYVSDGEHWLDKDCYPIQHTSSVRTQSRRLIIRKTEKPERYRQFKDAEEFKPHRGRWWYRDDKDGRRHFPPASYSDQAHGGATWKHRFETCFFDDGTPFGVKIDE